MQDSYENDIDAVLLDVESAVTVVALNTALQQGADLHAELRERQLDRTADVLLLSLQHMLSLQLGVSITLPESD